MRIFLDEDLASGQLAKLLQNAGHDVVAPAAAGTLRRADAVQLTCAIHEQRACLSRNYEDFEELHLLIAEAQGHHFGSKPLSVAEVKRLKAEQPTSVIPLQTPAGEAHTLETRVSDLVNAAYGLTPDEIALMWTTAPPRMPLADMRR